jgi:ADP-heptose:LPS heptosyltransferase
MSGSLIVKLPNWMGDILFSLDLLHSLSAGFDRIGLLTSTEHEELFRNFPVTNAEVLSYSPETWPFLSKPALQRIRDFKPDLGLVLPNSFGSALALRYAGVSRLYGYNTEHRGILLKKALSPPGHRVHQSEYYSKLLPLFELEQKVYQLPNSTQREKRVILHPGTSKPPRAWHLERFAKVAEGIRERGFEAIFVSGEVVRVGPFRVIVKPSLTEFCELLKSCSLFIGNDSGPLHLAQQCGAPVVGVYGPGNPMTTGPRDISPNRVVYHAFPCSPCRQKFFKECSPAPSGKPFCIETIQPDEVLKAALELV